jgi:hypothetical protein
VAIAAIVCTDVNELLCEEAIEEAYVVVWSALTSRENSFVDTLLQILGILEVLSEENQTSPGPT